MGLYVYAPKLTTGVEELIGILQAKRLVRHDGMHFLYRGTPIEFAPTDAIVCWGAHIPPIQNVPVLNANVEYPTLLQLNTVGLRKINNAGYTSLFPVQLSA